MTHIVIVCTYILKPTYCFLTCQNSLIVKFNNEPITIDIKDSMLITL